MTYDLVRDHYQAAIDSEDALLARVAAVAGIGGPTPPPRGDLRLPGSAGGM